MVFVNKQQMLENITPIVHQSETRAKITTMEVFLLTLAFSYPFYFPFLLVIV